MKKLGYLLFLGLLLQTAHAKRFANQYLEFELPPGWSCLLEGSEYVCQAENKDRKKEAIIIMAAKERGQQDSLDQYQAYLKKKKTYRIPGGKTQVSEAKYTRLKKINDQRWVDSLHLASEVPGFYTRYMATVKQNLGIAITFSVSKDNYQNYQGLFDKMIASMRVFIRGGAVGKGKWVAKNKDTNILDETSLAGEDPETFQIGRQGQKGNVGANKQEDMLLYGAIAAVVAVFIILKKLKK